MWCTCSNGDCSLQRRHQKVIEEAPAPGMDEATREAICAAAVKAAKAVDYVGAGTIEFIADASEGLRADRIWFMEMNTRLQVEHPVTEEITGVDLVEWQLRVASGEALPKLQEELSINGWAMEARLYAEDPATEFLPSTGRLERYFVDDDTIRVESGYERGGDVSPFYDPMIAKLIANGPDRTTAIDTLLNALDGTAIWPVKSNAGFLYRALYHPSFKAADISTAFIADHADELATLDEPTPEMLRQAACELVHQYEDAWGAGLTGLRLNAKSNRRVAMLFGTKRVEIEAPDDFYGPTHSSRAKADVALVTYCGETFSLALDHSYGTAAGTAADGAILSPMPGRIIAVAVAAGDTVTKGQKLVTLEAMKMEHSLTAPFDGKVAELTAVEGGQVSEGAVLVRLTATGSATDAA